MKCPVCKQYVGYYSWPDKEDGKPVRMYDYPLYQRSYVVPPRRGIITCHMTEGEKPISPRCSACYDKAERRLLMGKRDRERKERIKAGKEEPIARHEEPKPEPVAEFLGPIYTGKQAEPEPEPEPEEEQASAELLNASARLKKMSGG